MDKLHEKSLEFENDVEEFLIDKNGLLLSALNMDTMRPFPEGYFKGKSILNYRGLKCNDFSDLIKYENVGMCTGAYLSAMIWKYKATKEPDALEKAYRTFEGIKWLFNLSQKVEEGFYCKCFGGKLTEQISSDQYIYTLVALELFMELADHKTKQQCVDMIEKMVRFWIRKNYSYSYLGQPLNWPLERFPVFSWLAYQYTGKKEFLHEFNRLCSLNDVQTKIPFGQMSWENLIDHTKSRKPVFEFEKQSPLRLIVLNPENTESGFVSLEAMLKHNAPHRSLWMAKLKKMFERDKQWIAEDGYAKGPGIYNTETGKITEVRKLINISQNQHDWKFLNLVGWFRSAMHSTMFARASIAINFYLPNSGGLKMAADILNKLEQNSLHWFKDMDGEQFPDDLKWINKVYSGDAVTHWLWTYWEATAKYGKNWDNSN